jgi:hypothetical protein
MSHEHIHTKHALSSLTELHAELAGKIESNRKSGDKLRAQMAQVEAVIKMLDPEFNVAGIAAKRRRDGRHPWFKRGTLYRNAVAVLRNATAPMSVGELVAALAEAHDFKPTDQQAQGLETGIRRSLTYHAGKSVERVGAFPVRWRLMSL